MPRKSKLQLSQNKIVEYLDSLPKKIFTYNELGDLLSRQRSMWDLPVSTRTGKFVDLLERTGQFQEINLISREYRTISRYAWKTPSIFSIALSIKRNSYLSHGTAVFLHGLTDLIPKKIFVNHEQSMKPSKGTLIQERIDRAFAGKQRESKLVYEYEEYRITLVNGKWTGGLGVTKVKDTDSTMLDVTNIERTLIDIAVRPSYAGGVFEVLKIYEAAKTKVNVSKLLSSLKKMNYVYPYHQAIGFYMERAGYPEKHWTRLKRFGIKYNFYLTYGLPSDKMYDSKWRIYYPNGL